MNQFEYAEDSFRLPEGIKRIGYDADTARYTFCDREGNTYLGPPHEEYGSLTLVDNSIHDRPHAFASSENPKPDLSIGATPFQDSGARFHDFVPPHLITSPSSAESTLSGSPRSGETSSGSRLRDAVRRNALPSMQNVVSNVRRSTTSVLRRKQTQKHDNETTVLLPQSGPNATSKQNRSMTSAPATVVSFDVKHSKD
ncbi:hypothetical protein B0H16DRAFT_1591684 [Mycena metata]|uniref:Uncharacterized protein n=1 Tax=Mycena metata TaxID=1033252 RepID=A0AAD7MQ35_9AGAR|nr:hypothetical protein B0H16DRAFT_1591684 [Mycena metata]